MKRGVFHLEEEKDGFSIRATKSSSEVNKSIPFLTYKHAIENGDRSIGALNNMDSLRFVRNLRNAPIVRNGHEEQKDGRTCTSL